jgi:hypothetical protein
MAWTPFGWIDMPAELSPDEGETLFEWFARIAAYDAANPGELTEFEASRLEEFGEHVYDTAVADASGSAALATHEADTTGVHGIADTSALATDAEVASAVAAEATLRDAADDALDGRVTTLESAGSGSGLPSNFTARTSAYTASAGDFVLADATGGTFQVTLPAGTAGQLIAVKKVDGTANAVTVDVTGGGTIDGDAGGASIISPQFGGIFECSSAGVWQLVSPMSAGGSNGTDGEDGADGAPGAPGADGVIAEVQNEGSALADQSIMNFVGAGVDVTVAGGKYVVTIAGGSGITVQDENSNVATGVTQIDFQGAGVAAGAGSGEVVVTIPGGGSATPPNLWVPSKNNLKVASYNPNIAASAFTPTAGVVNLSEMHINDAQTLAAIWWLLSQALTGGGGGAANLFFGVYCLKAAGTLTLLGKTSDRVAAMSGVPSGGTPYSAALTAEAGESLALDGTKRVWGAVLLGTQGSTTLQIQRSAGNNAGSNAGLTAGTDPLVCCKSGTGQTTLPATIAVSGLTVDLPTWYGAS